MKRMLALYVILTVMISGCGEEKQPGKMNDKEVTLGKLASAANEDKGNINRQPAVSSDGLKAFIKPLNPVVGDCLEARYQGKRSGKTFVWEVNGIVVEQDDVTRYCLEDEQRGDAISVTINEGDSSDKALVMVVNSPPRIVNTRIDLITDGGDAYIEITPEVEDADGDFVSFEYQWLINGEVNHDYTENRLPSDAYQRGDSVQANITPDDNYIKGATYQSRNVNVPNAPPVITSQPPKSFEAMEYTYQVEATDVDSSELAFSLEDAPDGMRIDEETGMIVWPLAEVSAGEYQIKIVVTDPEGSTGGQAFTLDLAKRRAVKQEQQ